ncbi:acyl-CoA dehydrogenase family protein [Chondromyces apiculatus]|uniref:Butyryl-CoA dehydrogenase n=1 Tax=Chondromyces apiculatus DSM 436 TaxID=1192034 RepID=A0A017T3A3_9BACT|nr:acyl-CoA dehydrogenase family protein [Chondromyces apiculatus]EYF03729.1 Butyryl-CoA dehydrogenase [Chondromyces apiculatus DSM 436]
MEWSESHLKLREEIDAFVEAHVRPHAGAWDREERMPSEPIQALAARGYLGALISREAGGGGVDALSFGLLNEALGRGCSSLRSLVTVHSMVAHAVERWGSRALRDRWLPALARGAALGAFGLTEPQAGSDPGGIETTATERGDTLVLNGRKRWITFGEIADVFVIFLKLGGAPAAVLVPSDSPGLSRAPIRGMLGTRASMLAEITLSGCEVPRDNLLARPGFGLSHVAQSALDWGRYSVAWGSVGIAHACLDASARYAEERHQFGARLRDHQLIRAMLTEMHVQTRAAALLCWNAGRLKDQRHPSAILETSLAKYFASRTAMRAATDAVQIHGANGCSADHPVERLLRDAKIMEIIEGSSQLHQISLADHASHSSPL